MSDVVITVTSQADQRSPATHLSQKACRELLHTDGVHKRVGRLLLALDGAKHQRAGYVVQLMEKKHTDVKRSRAAMGARWQSQINLGTYNISCL